MNTRWQLNWNKTSIFTTIVPLIGVALMAATTATASAQIIIPVGVVNQPHPPASFIYGSPIPTPVPVNPTTGLLPSTNYSYPGYYHPRRGTIVNSTLINPTLVNPTIQNSTLINPLIVNEQLYQPVYGTRVLRGSGIIFSYP